MRTLTGSAGVVYVSDRFTNRDNSVVAPSFTRLDASGSYEIARDLTVRVAANNVTNRRYVSSGGGLGLFAGPPRRIAVQLTTAF